MENVSLLECDLAWTHSIVITTGHSTRLCHFLSRQKGQIHSWVLFSWILIRFNSIPVVLSRTLLDMNISGQVFHFSTRCSSNFTPLQHKTETLRWLKHYFNSKTCVLLLGTLRFPCLKIIVLVNKIVFSF